MASSYVYRSHLPEGYIRLLKVVSDGSQYYGELEEFRLDRLPYFAALSWCWSSGPDTHSTFRCEDQDFVIPANLHEALRSLLPSGSPASLRVWVDAICINQSLVEEKNAHVPRMHEVYGKADFVVVWLGPSDKYSDLLLHDGTFESLAPNLALVPSYASPQSVTEHGLPATNDPIWQALGRLSERDWFYRTWVVQEVALAGRIDVLCGAYWLKWESLVSVYSHISRAGLFVLCRDPDVIWSPRANGVGVLLDMHYIKEMYRAGGVSISYLLHMVRLKEVNKPVDRIYGLLGIVGEQIRSAITVDYEKFEEHYWEVYVTVAQHILANDAASWLFCMSSSKSRPAELPSWCPNLDSRSWNMLDFGNQAWRAGIGEQSNEQAAMQFVPRSPQIKVKGFTLDIVNRVTHLGSPTVLPSAQFDGQADLDRRSIEQRYLETENECYLEYLRGIKRETESVTGTAGNDDTAAATEAYARTLVLNANADGSNIIADEGPAVVQAYKDAKRYLAAQFDESISTIDIEESASERTKNFHAYIRQLGWWGDRPIFTTDSGGIGRGPMTMREGDRVCAFYRAGSLFILRSGEHDDAYELVGDAYLHGFMDLDAVPPEGRKPDEDFIIG